MSIIAARILQATPSQLNANDVSTAALKVTACIAGSTPSNGGRAMEPPADYVVASLYLHTSFIIVAVPITDRQ